MYTQILHAIPSRYEETFKNVLVIYHFCFLSA
jgi:hypothetical protein